MSIQEYLLTLGIETKLLIGGLVGTVAGLISRIILRRIGSKNSPPVIKKS